MAQLINVADVVGTYQSIGVSDTTQVVVELSAVRIEKTADKRIWVDGELLYGITVTNIDESDPGEEVTDVVVTDNIDTEYAEFITGSLILMINGEVVPDPVYDIDPSGRLSVTIGTLQSGDVATISFRVNRL